jgi:homoserine kinase type II
MYTDESIREIVSSWKRKFRKSRPDIDIPGSPERTAYRVVVEDLDSRLWVLEAIPPGTHNHKYLICKVLSFLHDKGFKAVAPYLPSTEDRPLVCNGTECWQIRPFIEGVPLPRPSFVTDRWRGKACADFLLDLRDKARDLPIPEGEVPFSMIRFIRGMYDAMAGYNPETHGRMRRAFDFIEQEFAHLEGVIPTAFCHGDFHPLNVIWSNDGIKSVIDWEFLGYKPEVYDVANLIGCVGFEDPAGLTQGLVTGLISTMRKADALSPACWEYLAEWVIAIRFAWLSDWLRRRDREMIDLEGTYIHLLIRNRQALKDFWNQAAQAEGVKP